ncbi:hypothetical protein [Saccharothrix sp. ALI-22-I]|nr:hypothetical protein [Saccharothrix sp. ALI-22-I]
MVLEMRFASSTVGFDHPGNGRGTTVWVFWGSDREGSMKIYTKRFVTAL